MTDPVAPRPAIRILGGNPSPEDVAAVTAVLTSALDELASENRRSSAAGPTGWQSSQRAIRTPLPFGAWRNLTG